MSKKIKIIFLSIIAIVISCLSFGIMSFSNQEESAEAKLISQGQSGSIYIEKGAVVVLDDVCKISQSGAIKGGAFYVAGTLIMNSGIIQGCASGKGGAFYVASTGNLILNGGTIQDCYATEGYAIYVEYGGKLTISDDVEFINCGEEQNLHIVNNSVDFISVNFYIDNELDTTKRVGILEKDTLPISDEDSCGWFLDENLTKVVDYSKPLLETYGENINLYTKTATKTGLEYALNSDGETYNVKGTGSLYGDVVIPRKYEGKLVTMTPYGSSTSGAFSSCQTAITGITFPNGLVTIGSYSFYNCTKLAGNLVIPDSVTNIGSYSFQNCQGFTGSLRIPDSVISIEECSFQGCRGFTGNLIIGNGVNSIGDSAFTNCSGFTGDLVIPNSVTNIGRNTFNGCSGFTGSLTLSNITNIEDFVFLNCSGFTGDLIIPNNVASIGISAFEGCSGFDGTITLSNSLTNIENNAFLFCSGFTAVLITDLESWCSIDFESSFSNPLHYAKNLYLNNQLLTDLVVPEGVTAVKNYAFYNATCLTNVIIPNSITSIGNYAFYTCLGLKSIFIPSSVTNISVSWPLFYDCSSSMVIYCEILEADKPSSWSNYWNYYSLEDQLQVVWGVSLEEYNNIISSSSTNSFVSDIAIVEISENYEQILASKKELEALISDGKFEIVSDEDVKIA